MCGLFGMMGHGIIGKDLDIIDDLMLVSSTRGMEGTGLSAGRSYDSRAHTFKVPGDPLYWRYMGNDEKKTRVKDIYDISNSWFVGHTRSPSTGTIDMPSTQPFVYPSIVGTHNGTLFGDYHPFPTDSAKLIARIATGAESVPEIIGSLGANDSYALAWYNFEDKAMHFLRNGKRSLFFAVNKKRSVIYWASEARFLRFALAGEEFEMFYFEENKHYTIPVKSIKVPGKYELNIVDEIPQPTNVKVFDKTKILPITKQTSNDNPIIGETPEELNDIPWLRDIPRLQHQKKKVTIN